MKKIEFYKMAGAGNDFIVIDNRKGDLKGDLSLFAKEFCNRNTGIGADGMILMENSMKTDFKMRIFNADGSEAEMCGNGARCVALFAFLKKAVLKEMRFETMAGTIEAEITGKEKVRTKLGNPHSLRTNIELDAEGQKLSANFINTGVPHTVIFYDDVEGVNVKDLGKSIRFHAQFAPAGTNVNFVQVTAKNKIRVRTYERGVEDETLACGTGSTASAIISAIAKNVKSPVSVTTQSGLVLSIDFKVEANEIKDVFLEGEARVVFTGVYGS